MVTLKIVDTGSDGNCYIITDSCNQKLILDAGRPIKEVKQTLGFDVRQIEGVLVTHAHQDHSEYTNAFKKMGIPVWEPYKTLEESKLKAFGNFTVRSIPLRSKNGWCHTNSDGTECPIYAYIIFIEQTRLLYMTDFLYSPYTFKSFKITDMLIEGHHCEGDLDEEAANYYHTILGHPSIKITKDIVQINQTDSLKFVGLIHSSKVADSVQLLAEVKATVNDNVTVDIASKGKTYTL